MKYGIISDIHANLEALTAVLSHLEGADRLICLGDIVGYGPDPNECCEIIRSLDCVTILGNHDQAAVCGFDLNWFNPHARAAMEWTANALTPDNRRFLQSLPRTFLCEDFTAAHGSLPAPFEYITNPWESLPTFDEMNTALCLVGHSHIAEYYILREGRMTPELISCPKETAVSLRPNCRYIVNCGSVGQPRDGNPKAAFGLLDTEVHEIALHRCDYPFAATQEKIRAARLPSILRERLAVGR
ncbi:MAG: metallophosphoesterase family protein [Armatimonadetes bacterium]|nr:metallophosphoesterase family protein [Armatimonadota bacterium]